MIALTPVFNNHYVMIAIGFDNTDKSDSQRSVERLYEDLFDDAYAICMETLRVASSMFSSLSRHMNRST